MDKRLFRSIKLTSYKIVLQPNIIVAVLVVCNIDGLYMIFDDCLVLSQGYIRYVDNWESMAGSII